MRLETKAYEGFAAEVFHWAYVKYGSYDEVAGKIGATGHYVSDVAQGKTQPTTPMLLACLAEVVPWLPEEMKECVRKEGEKILEQRKAATKAAKQNRSPNFGYLPGSAEQAGA